ncbi:MAG: glutathione synthetase [Saprospiraceae bacterium]|nr:glutathione synthetase [Saprospiraceae bacterium]
MNGYHLLMLTDHAAHSAENSLYALASAIHVQPDCLFLDIASRSTPANAAFFAGDMESELAVVPLHEDLEFDEAQQYFADTTHRTSLSDYDFIILRLPPPLSRAFTGALTAAFDERRIANRPSGIFETGSKEFLLHFPELCPPMALITNADELMAFSAQFPIVLKPLRSYSGKGIARVQDGQVDVDDQLMELPAFIRQWDKDEPYLGMQFLRNVDQGDKRIVVCNGEVLGASLRLPRAGDWRCNVGQGGRSLPADITEGEMEIARVLYQPLYERGVVLFGFDTLVDDNGKRVLSEINATSIGGIKQMELQQGRPILSRAAALLMQYIRDSLENS